MKKTVRCASFRRALGGAEMPHWSTRPGGHVQSAGPPHAVAVVDLLDLGGVLDDLAERADEVVEGVVARPVAARAPLDRVAGVLHAAAAAHHRLEVGHQEGDVVQRVVVGVAERDAVVVAVAVHEGHDPRAVGQREAQRLLEEALRRGDVVAVEHHMRQTRAAGPSRSCASACSASPCTTSNRRPSGSRTVRPMPPAGSSSGASGAIDAAAGAHRRRPRPRAAPPRCAHASVTCADRACRRVRRAARAGGGRLPVPRRYSASSRARGDVEMPGARVEGLGRGEVGHVERHAAQRRDPGGSHAASLYTKLAIQSVKAQNASHHGPHRCPAHRRQRHRVDACHRRCTTSCAATCWPACTSPAAGWRSRRCASATPPARRRCARR